MTEQPDLRTATEIEADTNAAEARAALEPQPVEFDTDEESEPEEQDHAEFYDDEEEALDEPNFDAPEQNAKEGTS